MYFFFHFLSLLVLFLRRVVFGGVLRRDKSKSHKEYNDTKQVHDTFDSPYQQNILMGLYKGKLTKMTYRQAREVSLRPLYKMIEDRLKKQKKLKVIEIGCGAGFNLILLHRKFGDRLQLYGMDYAGRRVQRAKEQLGGHANLHTGSITEQTKYGENEFDIVFSSHCLEQIPHYLPCAIREMARITKKDIMLMEPAFSLANPAQKLYLIVSDFVTVMKEVLEESDLKLRSIHPNAVSPNPLNKSGVFILEKA